MDNKTYSPTEVGTLIEGFRSDVSTIAERLSSLIEDVSDLKNDSTEIKTRLTRVEDAVQVAVPSLFKRVSILETRSA